MIRRGGSRSYQPHEPRTHRDKLPIQRPQHPNGLVVCYSRRLVGLLVYVPDGLFTLHSLHGYQWLKFHPDKWVSTPTDGGLS